jgi:hypothetical protein
VKTYFIRRKLSEASMLQKKFLAVIAGTICHCSRDLIEGSFEGNRLQLLAA